MYREIETNCLIFRMQQEKKVVEMSPDGAKTVNRIPSRPGHMSAGEARGLGRGSSPVRYQEQIAARCLEELRGAPK